jgi:16S rRNA (guanine1516-N2)-methyltransferase
VYELVTINDCLALQVLGDDAPGPVYVDFVHGAVGHRRQFGGGKNQLIAKAVGIKASKEKLKVLDVTAGLGRDAFVLASLGCEVLMCERSPVIYQLLQDGLHRAKKEAWFQRLNLKLIQANAIDYLQSRQAFIPDVIYIDPMFPEKTKSALVKKEMRVLREVVGDDVDADQLLSLALSVAKKRVVVKRPRLASALTHQVPHHQCVGKSGRYDVYFCF